MPTTSSTVAERFVWKYPATRPTRLPMIHASIVETSSSPSVHGRALRIIEFTGWNEFIAQSIGFGIALIAFDATPRLIGATSDALARIPADLADRFTKKRP